MSSALSVLPSFSVTYSSSISSSFFSSVTPSKTFTTATSSSSTSSSTTSFTYQTTSSTTTTTTTTTPAVSSTSSTFISSAVDQSSSTVTSTSSTLDAGALSSATVSNALALSSGSATPSSTVTHSSSSDFFSNKGAVAGTFTVVGLVGIALVIALVMFIIKRHSKAYEEDAEFFDKNPDLSADPPMNSVTSMDDISSSDHAHYHAPPMAVAPPPVFYPDHTVSHPQAFQAESFPQPPSHGYPTGYAQQQYPAQFIYTPEDYDIGYPPVAPHGNLGPPSFTVTQVDSAPAPHAQATNALHPSTLTVPAQRADSRFSVDSFYTGIAQDSTTSTGQAF